MPTLSIRWSEHEAAKSYARPFGVAFANDDGSASGSVALSGADLLYLRQFQAAVLHLCGELFFDAALNAHDDPQRLWLDRIAKLLPALAQLTIVPASSFDHSAGRTFLFGVREGDAQRAVVDAPTLLEYQEFQAAVAHQCGRLFRVTQVEDAAEAGARHAAWERVLNGIVQRPGPSDAMCESWPWR
jgi:hypothetical protein